MRIRAHALLFISFLSPYNILLYIVYIRARGLLGNCLGKCVGFAWEIEKCKVLKAA